MPHDHGTATDAPRSRDALLLARAPEAEVGGNAATYGPPGDVERWTAIVLALLEERRSRPGAWQGRRDAGFARAAAFSWSRYTSELVDLYGKLSGNV